MLVAGGWWCRWLMWLCGCVVAVGGRKDEGEGEEEGGKGWSGRREVEEEMEVVVGDERWWSGVREAVVVVVE